MAITKISWILCKTFCYQLINLVGSVIDLVIGLLKLHSNCHSGYIVRQSWILKFLCHSPNLAAKPYFLSQHDARFLHFRPLAHFQRCNSEAEQLRHVQMLCVLSGTCLVDKWRQGARKSRGTSNRRPLNITWKFLSNHKYLVISKGIKYCRYCIERLHVEILKLFRIHQLN